MIKKAIISGVVFSSILLVGCNGEKEELTELVVSDSEEEAVDASTNEENDEINLLSELQIEILAAITEETEIDHEAIAIMLGGNLKEMSISVSFPKDLKVDDTEIQQIIEDSIQRVSETENVAIKEENVSITIEKY
ncbi:topoisomerase [Ureibacillus chungkukjangi]|uniref:topoisomerase n=1 Tax=Ureibacillus chungkukjangi TaxID=1202712 RepID=UPI00203B1DEB|nr:topoisomerase [Ureibacillus chungkukjangi]MCM3386958.1 topoisomerase [Ureibacillus chungkukjangi]